MSPKSQYWTLLLYLVFLPSVHGAGELAGGADHDSRITGKGKDIVPVLDSPVSTKKHDPELLQGHVPGMTGKEERTRSIIVIVSALILILALTAIIVLLVRRNHAFKAARGHKVEAYLNDYHGHTSAASYKLGAKPTLLGRVAGKDPQKSNFIVIPESTIGRRHALIDYKDHGYWISDQGSINGTFVNDKHITSGKRLKHGDKVRLHKYEFEFIIPGASGAGAAVVPGSSFSEKQTASVETEAVLQEVQQEMSQVAAELDFDFGAVTDEEVNAKEATSAEDKIADETLMPSDADVDQLIKDAVDDETLLPGSFDPVADEIEAEQEADTSGHENFFGLTGDSEEDIKKE